MDTQSSDLCSCALDSHRNIACCINCCFSVWGEKCLMVIGNASVGAKKREFYSYSMFRKSLTLLTQGLGMYKVKRQRSNTQNNPGQIISSVKHEDNPGSFCSMSYFSQCSCRRSQSDNKKVATLWTTSKFDVLPRMWDFWRLNVGIHSKASPDWFYWWRSITRGCKYGMLKSCPHQVTVKWLLF